MTKNVCGVDKAVRTVAGLVLLASGIFRLLGGGYWGYVSIAAGIFFLITAAIGFCCFYFLFGISTRGGNRE
ncbi:DUF2892 domain-containing protein [bacterium]|nr:MAG: DUF2892 domain-containing protein [bacterium]